MTVHLLYREFVIFWDLNPLDVFQWQQVLFFDEDLLDEVLVEHLIRWTVQLETFPEILKEVFLALEASEQIRSKVSPLFGALQLLDVPDLIFHLNFNNRSRGNITARVNLLFSWINTYNLVLIEKIQARVS